MKSLTIKLAIISSCVLGCGPGEFATCDDSCAEDTGDSGVELCEVSEPCTIEHCVLHEDGHVACAVVVYLEVGHRGDVAFQLPGTGDLKWNELPYNLDAGFLEDAHLTGTGQMCGAVSFYLPDTIVDPQLVMICEDTTLGQFRVSDPYALGSD